MSIAFACQESSVAPIVNNKPLETLYLDSDAFKKLNVGVSELTLSKMIVKTDDEKSASIIIPFSGQELKYVIGHAYKRGDEVKFVFAAILEYETNLNYHQFSEAIKKGSFSTVIKLETSLNERLDLVVVDGKLNTERSLRLMEAGRTAVNYCTDMKSYLTCAAIKIDSKNWLEYSICVATIPECLAQEVANCVIEGCQELNPENFWPS